MNIWARHRRRPSNAAVNAWLQPMRSVHECDVEWLRVNRHRQSSTCTDMMTQFHGTYAGTNSCAGPFNGGQMSMLHQ